MDSNINCLRTTASW